jgi:MoxR-like ATPase
MVTITSGLLGYDSVDKAGTLAVAAGEHLLIVGPPGRAKSLFYRKFFANLDGRFFETQLSKFSDDSALFGAPDLKEMRETGKIVYPKAGIADADYVGIDEIFDASDICLRTLNGWLNERKVLRGHEAYSVPLKSCFATANYTRQNEVIAAVIDRFALAVVTPNLDEKARKALYNGEAFEKIESPVKLVSNDELDYIREKANYVKIADSLVTTLVRWAAAQLFTPRRERTMSKLLRVSAAMSGRIEVDERDLEVIRFVCPLTPGMAQGTGQDDPSKDLRDGIKRALNEAKQLAMIDQFRNVKREQGDRQMTYVKNLTAAIKMITDIMPVSESVQQHKDGVLENLRTIHREQLDGLGVIV